jgi:hypothetical protein
LSYLLQRPALTPAGHHHAAKRYAAHPASDIHSLSTAMSFVFMTSVTATCTQHHQRIPSPISILNPPPL